jgi:DNA-binding GntR family transcriptional regulator
VTWAALSHSSHLLELNIEQHRRILEAIESRDAAGARRQMSEHVRSAGELVAELLDRSST